MSGDIEKAAAARLSVWSNSSLVSLKLVVGVLMGSVGVLSEALHSGIDLVAAIIARYSVKRSAEPADRDHQYGHGKFENMSGFVEGALIFAVAAIIVFEASRRLLSMTEVEYVPAGMAVMAVSTVVNICVSRRLFDVAKRTDSLALEADACHLRTDVWTSAGVFVALGIIQVTGWQYVDPIVAMVVAGLIIRAAYSITTRSADGLLDRTLPEEEMRIVKEVLIKHEMHFVDWHRLRSRKTGSERQLDLHVTVPSAMSVSESHDLVETMEGEIHRKLPRSTIVIHVEPCEKDCETCRIAESERASRKCK
ncbi:MAG: cation diffusion facilitator family transporter [Thermoplasmata archaeon]|nr:cation diffusion facilitator family transporter [Thermoplasmata archaeon]